MERTTYRKQNNDKKRRAVIDSDESDAADTSPKTSTPGNTNKQKTRVSSGSRSSTRIQEKGRRVFHMPDRNKVFDAIENRDEHYSLSLSDHKPRKLVNDLLKCNNRYNYDVDETSGESDGMADFIEEEFEYVDESDCVSEDSNAGTDAPVSKIKTKSKKTPEKKRKSRRITRKTRAACTRNKALIDTNKTPAQSPCTSRNLRSNEERKRSICENTGVSDGAHSDENWSPETRNKSTRRRRRPTRQSKSDSSDDSNSNASELGEIDKSILERVNERSKSKAEKKNEFKHKFDVLKQKRARRNSAGTIESTRELFPPKLDIEKAAEVGTQENPVSIDLSPTDSDLVCLEALEQFENAMSNTGSQSIPSSCTSTVAGVKSEHEQIPNLTLPSTSAATVSEVKVEREQSPENNGLNIINGSQDVKPNITESTTQNIETKHAANCEVKVLDCLKSNQEYNGSSIQNRAESSSDESDISPTKSKNRSAVLNISESSGSDTEIEENSQNQTQPKKLKPSKGVQFISEDSSSDAEVVTPKRRPRKISRLESDDDESK